VTDETEQFRAALREELACLWSDLATDRRMAFNGVWSVACESTASRIATITALVGPTPWEQIQPTLLEDGTYLRLHAEMGITAEVDEAAVAEFLDEWRRSCCRGFSS
jgi:hypothetical protein